MKKTFVTYDGTILKEGKKYRWSGCSEGLYTGYHWKNLKCKIKYIYGEKIYIYDYDDKTEYEYTNTYFIENNVTFK